MKQLIILVCYINMSNTISFMKMKTRIRELQEMLGKTFNQEVQKETNTIIKTIVIPVKQDQNTYIECIFPTEPDLPEEIIEKFEQIKLTQKEYDINRS